MTPHSKPCASQVRQSASIYFSSPVIDKALLNRIKHSLKLIFQNPILSSPDNSLFFTHTIYTSLIKNHQKNTPISTSTPPPPPQPFTKTIQHTQRNGNPQTNHLLRPLLGRLRLRLQSDLLLRQTSGHELHLRESSNGEQTRWGAMLVPGETGGAVYL